MLFMRYLLAVIFAFSAVFVSSHAQDIPEKRMMLVVLVGQSNMSGRGKVEPEDKIPIPNVYTLDKEGKWIPSVEPTHFERVTCGTCLGRTFAEKLHQQYPDRVIGIVPCAVGGSPIEVWFPGAAFERKKAKTIEHPYDDAIARIKIAQKDGDVIAVLWHQGCSNNRKDKAFDEAYADYRAKLEKVIQNFRTDIPELAGVPFILGHLEAPKFKVDHVNQTIDDIVKNDPLTAAVSADGVTLNSDNVHYDRRSLKMLGERYFEAYQKLKSKTE